MSSFDSEAFAAAGQSHLLQRLDQLSGEQAERFQRDLEQLDLSVLQRLWSEGDQREEFVAPDPPSMVDSDSDENGEPPTPEDSDN